MSAADKATPRPWRVHANPWPDAIYGGPSFAQSVAQVWCADLPDGAANAALIVAAVNEREALIAQRDELAAALRDLLNYTGGHDLTDASHPIVAARAALAEVTP